MNKEFDKLVESLWEERKRPKKVSSGQIWTVFADSDADRGCMVLITHLESDSLFALPLHHEFGCRRGVDPILKKEQLDFKDKLVILIDTTQKLSLDAFTEARFIGNVTKKGMEVFFQGLKVFNKVSNALVKLKMLEASGMASEEDEDKAFEDGILELVPLKASTESFESFKAHLLSNLMPWIVSHHIQESTENILETTKNNLKSLKTSVELMKDDVNALNSLLPIVVKLCRTIFFHAKKSEDFVPIYETLQAIIPESLDDFSLKTMYRDSALLSGVMNFRMSGETPIKTSVYNLHESGYGYLNTQKHQEAFIGNN